jgi:hypothetical protein
MARTLRLQYGGAIYPVKSRGNHNPMRQKGLLHNIWR